MGKVATYEDLLAEIEAQQAYITQLEQEREALQKELAELRYVDVSKIMPNKPATIQSAFAAMSQAAQDFGVALSATEANRVPLMEGYYVRDGAEAIAWVPTYAEAIAHKVSNTQFSAMTDLESVAHGFGLSLSPADFEPLREAYYAQR